MTQDNETKYTRREILKQGMLGVSALILAGSGLLAGCGASDNHDDDIPTNTSDRANSLASMPRVTVFAKNNGDANSAYQCWIAGTPSQRFEGLSFVSDAEMPKGIGRGMAFVYPDNQILSYAGRNTLVDLDVVYAVGVGPGVGIITDIGTIVPFQRIPFASSQPAQFALMVRGGELARSGAQVGDYLYIPVNTPVR